MGLGLGLAQVSIDLAIDGYLLPSFEVFDALFFDRSNTEVLVNPKPVCNIKELLKDSKEFECGFKGNDLRLFFFSLIGFLRENRHVLDLAFTLMRRSINNVSDLLE